MEGNGQTYNVQFLGPAKSKLKQQLIEAAAVGNGEQVATALKQIIARLKKAPLIFGEPLFRLRKLKLQVRQGVIAPLVIDYGVHDEEPLVLIRNSNVLS